MGRWGAVSIRARYLTARAQPKLADVWQPYDEIRCPDLGSTQLATVSSSPSGMDLASGTTRPPPVAPGTPLWRPR
jgi:hypothetical protein